MKKETLALTFFFICAALTFGAASARAESVSTSQARIDWTSLIITGDITWLHQGSQSYAYAEDVTGSDEELQGGDWWGWVDPTSASASTLYAYGDAYTDDDYLYEEVYAIANMATTPWAYSEAYAERWGDFVADLNGWVEFSANYELSQNLGTDYVGEWAYGFAAAQLRLVNPASVEASDGAAFDNLVSDGASITDLDTGMLMVTVWFNAGEPGFFDSGVYNTAEVQAPEPATIALLGLGALTLLRRKR